MSKRTKNTDGGARWRIQDLIDLEYFLHGEGLSSSPSSRDIYLSKLRHIDDDGTPAVRRRLIKGWLDERRNAGGATPGDVFRDINRIGRIISAVLGVMGGGGLAASLLHYSGARPLNVSLYLGTGVFAQLLLLVVLATLFSFRAKGSRLVADSVVAKLLGRVVTAVFLKARGKVLGRAGAQTREALAAASGLFLGRRRVYGSLFFWPVFIFFQVFAISFNAGLLGGTLVKLAGSDVAFGWQSTFQQVGPTVVYRIVETLALPWRGLLPPGIAHPSLEQIEGSRIILKEGIYCLATGDLVSWWPFLCLSVFFYGLLPRLLLLLWGVFFQRHLLSRLTLDHGSCDQLVRSMLTPVVQTDGGPAVSREGALPAPDADAPDESHSPAGGGDGRVALVPEDIFDACDGLEDAAAMRLGVRVTGRKMIGGGRRADREVLEALGSDGAGGVLVVQEAWQPPIREMLSFLKALRNQLGDRERILVGLIGKPGDATIFTRVRDENFQIWKRGLDALADPYLTVERLGHYE